MSTIPYEDDPDWEAEPRGPLVHPLVGLVGCGTLCLLVLISVSAVLLGGIGVGSAEEATLVQAGELARAVAEERQIIDELASRGGDRAKLERLYEGTEAAEGQDKGRAAMRYARAVESEIVTIGDVRGTALDTRREKLSIRLKNYERAHGEWSSAAGGIPGSIAVLIGTANPPVE